MKRWKIIAMLLGVGAAAAWAQPGPGREAGGRMHAGPDLGALLENEHLVEKIGLTPEQVKTLKARHAEAEKTRIKLRANAELAEADVRRLMREDTVDRAAILSAVESAGAARVALRKAVIEEQLAFREIAGPDAAKKARRLMAKRMRESRFDERSERPPRRERPLDGMNAPPESEAEE